MKIQTAALLAALGVAFAAQAQKDNRPLAPVKSS